MNSGKREVDYPVELESQFVLRLPEEPAKSLREVLRAGENLKNRLTISINNDMRHGEVVFDHWQMHAKLVDLPTIIESLKTIDNKSFYKSADICQMMICKMEPDPAPAEEESPTKNKKKDLYKVDKKYLWPHGVTPPTKNVRKRRFRKTLKKKYVEAPEIEKEVKRLLRADNEADSVTWEIINEDVDQQKTEASTVKNVKPEKKPKQDRIAKQESTEATNREPSNVVDIFGGAVSDSDLEDDNMNMEMEDSRLSAYDSRMSDTSSLHANEGTSKGDMPIQFDHQMFQYSQDSDNKTSTSQVFSHSSNHKIQDLNMQAAESNEFQNMSQDNMNARIEQLQTELEELKQRRQRTQLEINEMENLALRQRFQEILHTLNQDIMYKQMEYQGLLTLQNSKDI